MVINLWGKYMSIETISKLMDTSAWWDWFVCVLIAILITMIFMLIYWCT